MSALALAWRLPRRWMSPAPLQARQAGGQLRGVPTMPRWPWQETTQGLRFRLFVARAAALNALVFQ